MRKIMAIILCFLCVSVNVKAEVLYSDYGEFTLNHPDYVEASDTVDVEVTNKYRYYFKQLHYGGYYLEGQNEEPFNLIDYDDFVTQSDTIWRSNIPDEVINRVIEEKEGISGFKVKSMHLYNIHDDKGYLQFAQPMIMYNSSYLPYIRDCYNCSEDYGQYMFLNLSENSPYIMNDDGMLSFQLLDYYDIDIIRFSFQYDKTDNLSFVMRFSSDNSFDGEEYIDVYVELNNGDENLYVLNVNNDALGVVTHTTDDYHTTVYNYTDYYYHYYFEEIRYSPIYTDGPFGGYTYRDDNDYVTFYRYRTREKIVLSDNLVANYKNFKLEDIVLESNVDYVLESNFNINKNGYYDVTIYTPKQTINRKVLVDIYENTLEELYNNLLSEYDVLYNENNILNEQLEQYMDEYYYLLNRQEEDNNLIFNLENELINMGNNYNELLVDYDLLSTNLEEKNSLIKEISENNISMSKQIEDYIENISDLEVKFNDSLEEIKNLNKENKNLLKNNNSLSKKIEKLEDNIISLKAKVKELSTDLKSLEKENKKLKSNNEKLEEKVNSLNSSIKDLKKENNVLVNKISDKEKEIIKYEELNRELISLNDEKIKDIVIKYEEKIDEYERVLKEKDDEIRELLQNNEELNKKIAKQNSNIYYLEKMNNENNEKYNNELLELNVRIDNLEKENNDLKNNYSVCLDEEKEMYLKQAKIDKIGSYKNYIIYVVMIMTIFMNYYLLYKKKNVELK